jgi:hypothetical protein
MVHSWSQEVIDPLDKLMSQNLTASVNVVGKKLAFT